MKATLTLKIKLETTEQAAQSLSETQKAYAIALNRTSEVAFEQKVFNSVALHHITYRDMRELTKLPANLVCSARCVVAEAYRRDKTIHFKQRRDLQAARHKSRNQRRLLKRLAGKEKRSVDWRLWNVANEIVEEALKADAGTIVVENLRGIRERVKVAKKQRLIHHGWPFTSLFSKIGHVASKHGIKVESVDARNTSKTCHKCGYCDSANRKSQSVFVCVRCGHKSNADFNASLNVRDRRAFHGCESVTTRSESAATGRAKKAALL